MKLKSLTVFLIGSMVLLQTACQAALPKVKATCEVEVGLDTTPFLLSYNLQQPDWEMKMPHELDEISGLGISDDGRYLVTVQDEKGKIFWIDIQKKEVSRKQIFWKDGDYEGIEMLGDKIYVLKSTGTLYAVSASAKDESETVKYNGFLSSENNVEGLGYDVNSNQLLLACKAKAGEDSEFEYSKAIYAFDLAKGDFLPDPRYCIRLEQVNDYLETNPMIRKLEKLEEFFAPGDSEFGFSPSALAVNPDNGDLYVLSSVGKMLMIISHEGKIRHIEKLKKSIHAQPEGICFDKAGNLYISNEGKDGNGTIYRFNFLGE